MITLKGLGGISALLANFAGVRYVAAAIVGSAAIGAAASSRNRNGTTTVVNQPPPQTDAEAEAERLRLAELRRQNQIAEQLLPGQLALIDQQRRLIDFQIANQGAMDEYQRQQLRLAQLQIDQQIADAAMQQELRPQQLEFLHNQNQLAIQQIASLTETTAAQREQNKYILDEMRDRARRLEARNAAYSPEEEAQAAAEEARRAARMSALSEEAANIQLENLKRGNKPTDEQLANINESIDAAQAYGESDIKRFLLETTRQINEETAQAAGLRATDAPVVRLSERAGEEAARAQGQLTNKLAETRATARLNYPLAANKLESDIAGSVQSLAQGASQFQQELRLSAANNRTQAFALPASVGFAMPQSGPAANLSFMNPGSASYNPGAFNANFSRGGGTQTTTSTSPLNLGQIAGGVGSLMTGYSRLFAGS